MLFLNILDIETTNTRAPYVLVEFIIFQLNPSSSNVPFMWFVILTRSFVFTSTMFEKHLQKSDISGKAAGLSPALLLKMSLFHRYFSIILLVKTNYLVCP